MELLRGIGEFDFSKTLESNVFAPFMDISIDSSADPRATLPNKGTDRVVIAQIPSPAWEAPAWVPVVHQERRPTISEMLQHFRSWHYNYRARPVFVSSDAWGILLESPPDNLASARALAREQQSFCPGVGSDLEQLARSLLGLHFWCFRWSL